MMPLLKKTTPSRPENKKTHSSLLCPRPTKDALISQFVRVFIHRGQPGGGEAMTLQLMSLCEAIFVSDSLSWWAAFLGEGMRVVMAERWKGGGQAGGLDARKLALSWWETVAA